jgi:hypothetical protein
LRNGRRTYLTKGELDFSGMLEAEKAKKNKAKSLVLIIA